MVGLRRENARLRRLVAELSLQRRVLTDDVVGNFFSIRGSSVNSVSFASWFDA